MDANRRHNRVPLEVSVSMASENNFYSGITDNISEGGLFIATHTPPPRGATVDLMLELPEAKEVFMITGVVRWIRSFEASCEGAPPGCGVEWLSISPNAMQAVTRFVRERETIYYEHEGAI